MLTSTHICVYIFIYVNMRERERKGNTFLVLLFCISRFLLFWSMLSFWWLLYYFIFIPFSDRRLRLWSFSIFTTISVFPLLLFRWLVYPMITTFMSFYCRLIYYRLRWSIIAWFMMFKLVGINRQIYNLVKILEYFIL